MVGLENTDTLKQTAVQVENVYPCKWAHKSLQPLGAYRWFARATDIWFPVGATIDDEGVKPKPHLVKQLCLLVTQWLLKYGTCSSPAEKRRELPQKKAAFQARKRFAWEAAAKCFYIQSTTWPLCCHQHIFLGHVTLSHSSSFNSVPGSFDTGKIIKTLPKTFLIGPPIQVSAFEQTHKATRSTGNSIFFSTLPLHSTILSGRCFLGQTRKETTKLHRQKMRKTLSIQLIWSFRLPLSLLSLPHKIGANLAKKRRIYEFNNRSICGEEWPILQRYCVSKQ